MANELLGPACCDDTGVWLCLCGSNILIDLADGETGQYTPTSANGNHPECCVVCPDGTKSIVTATITRHGNVYSVLLSDVNCVEPVGLKFTKTNFGVYPAGVMGLILETGIGEFISSPNAGWSVDWITNTQPTASSFFNFNGNKITGRSYLFDGSGYFGICDNLGNGDDIPADVNMQLLDTEDGQSGPWPILVHSELCPLRYGTYDIRDGTPQYQASHKACLIDCSDTSKASFFKGTIRGGSKSYPLQFFDPLIRCYGDFDDRNGTIGGTAGLIFDGMNVGGGSETGFGSSLQFLLGANGSLFILAYYRGYMSGQIAGIAQWQGTYPVNLCVDQWSEDFIVPAVGGFVPDLPISIDVTRTRCP